jgi:hypothetical protein
VHQTVVEANLNPLALCGIECQFKTGALEPHISLSCHVGCLAERKAAWGFRGWLLKGGAKIRCAYRFLVFESNDFATRFSLRRLHSDLRIDGLVQQRPEHANKTARQKHTELLLRRRREAKEKPVFCRIKSDLELMDRHVAWDSSVLPAAISSENSRTVRKSLFSKTS